MINVLNKIALRIKETNLACNLHNDVLTISERDYWWFEISITSNEFKIGPVNGYRKKSYLKAREICVEEIETYEIERLKNSGVKINKMSQLWEGLSSDDIAALRNWVEDLLFRGKIAYPNPPWLEMWYQELGYDDRQRLLASTAVPQRILMSIVMAQDIQIKRIQSEYLQTTLEGLI
jgi:hypothetical protein